MSKITIGTLANRLGLSKATVSKALKDSYEISSETKKKVLSLASDLNYVPNPYASGLRSRKSKTIAVVLPEIADNFFALAINGIQSVAAAKNYHVLIYLSHENFENEKDILSQCASGRVDGILISVSNETTETAHLDKVRSKSIPLVFFDRTIESFPSPKVLTNDYECGIMAAKHLLEKGCHYPIFLSLSDRLSICQKRSQGFINTLHKMGFPGSKQMHFVIDNAESDGNVIVQLRNIFKAHPRIDGIVASVEKIAIQIYFLGLNIPKDLKIIAFSALQTASILNPPLSTISQPAFEMGKNAAEILFSMIERRKKTVPDDFIMTIPSVLVERASTQ
ncbi:MAG: LacI family DNA-binding transcriptional regulator [Chitinophagaceae bacterium]